MLCQKLEETPLILLVRRSFNNAGSLSKDIYYSVIARLRMSRGNLTFSRHKESHQDGAPTRNKYSTSNVGAASSRDTLSVKLPPPEECLVKFDQLAALAFFSSFSFFGALTSLVSTSLLSLSTSTTTWSPSLNSPLSISFARGSWIIFCMVLLSGRAP